MTEPKLDLSTGCVVLPGRLSSAGYMRICRRGEGFYAHRFVFEEMYGPIPDGHEVHHACENRGCCNPLHLQLLTVSEHKRAHLKDFCINGHPYTDENLYVSPQGKRSCIPCRQARYRRQKALDGAPS